MNLCIVSGYCGVFCDESVCFRGNSVKLRHSGVLRECRMYVICTFGCLVLGCFLVFGCCFLFGCVFLWCFCLVALVCLCMFLCIWFVFMPVVFYG